MSTDNCCPTCGGKLTDEQTTYDHENRVFIASGISVRFPRSQAEVFNAVWKSRHRGGVGSIERLAEIAWADRRDGGPDGYNTLSVQLVYIRLRLAPTGYTITQNIGRPKQGYRLVRTEKANELAGAG